MDPGFHHSRSTERAHTSVPATYTLVGAVNMMKVLAPELGMRKRAVWGAHKSIEDMVKKTKKQPVRPHLFSPTVPPALTYVSRPGRCMQDENAVNVVEPSIEREMLGVTRFTQMRQEIRSSGQERRSTRVVTDWISRDVECTIGSTWTRWPNFFTSS